MSSMLRSASRALDQGPVNVGQGERWISMLAGGACVALGLMRRSTLGSVVALIGGDLIVRGLTGHSGVYRLLGVSSEPHPVHVDYSVTINQPAGVLYNFWRAIDNLPLFMTHLESVQSGPDGRVSHWVARAPANRRVEWDASIIDDRPGELIAWRSLPGSDVENEGVVRFLPAPTGRGTLVRVLLRYAPPAGRLGLTMAKLFGEEPSQQIRDDLRRFKRLMEAGEIPTTEGQPAGPGARWSERFQRGALDPSLVVTHHFSLDDAPEAYKTFKHKDDECIKVVLRPGGLPPI